MPFGARHPVAAPAAVVAMEDIVVVPVAAHVDEMVPPVLPAQGAKFGGGGGHRAARMKAGCGAAAHHRCQREREDQPRAPTWVLGIVTGIERIHGGCAKRSHRSCARQA